MQRWEYKMITRGYYVERQEVVWFDTGQVAVEPGYSVAKRLNAEGKEGWELVYVEDLRDTELWMATKTYYLKRLME